MSQIPKLNNITLKWKSITTTTKNHSPKKKSAKVNFKASIEDEKNNIVTKYEHAENNGSNAALDQISVARQLFDVASAIGSYAAEVLGEELAYAVNLGGAIGLGVGVVTSLVGKVVESNMKKKILNEKINKFNEYLLNDEKYCNKINILKKELIKQENKLNKFQIERYDGDSKTIVAIGPTGYGKSLFCNRILGNMDDILDIEDDKNVLFNVANCGDTESCTNGLKKVMKKVIIIDKNTKIEKKNELIISVVDTPGAFDSKGNDKHYQNVMKEYFTACGGVNLFLVFFRFGDKLDDNYNKLLKCYEKFWGTKFWKHIAIVITKCDMDTEKNKKILNKGIKNTVKDIKLFLKKISNGECNDNINIFEFGEENFKLSVKRIIIKLLNKRVKYVCDSIRSPIDDIWEKMKILLIKHSENKRNLSKIVDEINKLKE